MIIGVTGTTGELGRQPVRYESPTTPLRSAVAEALRGRAAAT